MTLRTPTPPTPRFTPRGAPASEQESLPAVGTLGLKSITVTNLHKAVKLLAASEERVTNGHNYVLYRLPNGKQVELPKIRKQSGSKQTGRRHLKSIIEKIVAAGVPSDILAQALAHAGAAWHQPPEPNPRLLKALKEQSPLVKKGQWTELLLLTTPHQAPANPNPTPAAPTPAAHEAKPAPQAPEPNWCDMSLRDIVELDLPINPDASTSESITRSFARLIARPSREPFISLVSAGQIIRTLDPGQNARPKYKISEHAATILASEARARYEEIIPPTPTQPQPTAVSTPKPTPAPAVKPEPKPTPAPQQASAPKPAATPKPAAAAKPQPTPRPEPTPQPTEETMPNTSKQTPTTQAAPQATAPVHGDPLPLNEAIGALIKRFGATLPLDKDLRVDVNAFVINLEQATRLN